MPRAINTAAKSFFQNDSNSLAGVTNSLLRVDEDTTHRKALPLTYVNCRSCEPHYTIIDGGSRRGNNLTLWSSAQCPRAAPPSSAARASDWRACRGAIDDEVEDMNRPQFVYGFENGDAHDKMLLGGKGANLCSMTQMGLDVPPGFVITTEACLGYLDRGRLPDGLLDEVRAHIAELEARPVRASAASPTPCSYRCARDRRCRCQG